MAASKWLLVLSLPGALALAGCGSDEPVTSADATPIGFDDAAHDELVATGLNKYFGRFQPEKIDKYTDYDVYTFKPDDAGPVCIHGSPFRVSVRDVGSPDLQIYLQGGGACWSELMACNTDANAGILPVGWTSTDPEFNPALASFNVVYVAYCDGSVHSGDNVVLNDDGSIQRRHRGVANLSAALDVARARFPHPRRIVLSGSSAGGFGTILGTALVRLAYPHTRLFVIDDAGVGVTNPADPSLMKAATDEWKVTQFLPTSCVDCVSDGQFTSIVSWGLDHDPSLRVSVFSSYQDGIISGAFLHMTGPDFENLMLEETGKVLDAHPDSYHRFIWKGAAHTAILGGYTSLTIRGTTLTAYTEGMLKGTPVWRDLLQ